MKCLFLFTITFCAFVVKASSKSNSKDKRIHDGDVIDNLYKKVESIEAELKGFEKDMKIRNPFPVRLVNNGVIDKQAGRVEVFANGEWGNVCDNYADSNVDQSNDNVAIVVCRMLGWTGGQLVQVNGQTEESSEFGRNKDRPILLTNVQCNGGEESLFDCAMNVDIPNHSYGCIDDSNFFGTGYHAYLGVRCS